MSYNSILSFYLQYYCIDKKILSSFKVSHYPFYHPVENFAGWQDFEYWYKFDIAAVIKYIFSMSSDCFIHI